VAADVHEEREMPGDLSRGLDALACGDRRLREPAAAAGVQYLQQIDLESGLWTMVVVDRWRGF
jgi:hypothetical protein